MRKGAQHPVMKILFVILAGMFVLWGVGDVFRNGGSNAYVATLGKSGITSFELDNVVRRELAGYQRATGKTLSEEEIASMGIRKYALWQLIRDKIITLRATEMHLVAGKKNVADNIHNNDIFFNKDGKFDKARFRQLLRENGFTEEQFINSIRKEYASNELLGSLSAVAAVSDIMTEKLYNYRNESRTAKFITLPISYIKDIAEPSETDLVQFYQNNQSKFSMPEQRSVSYITFGLDQVKDSIKFSDEELQQQYQNNIAQYQTDEERNITQYLFSKEDDANNAYEKISKGDIKEFTKNKVELGEVTKAGLPEEVKEVVFAMQEKEVSKPVKSQLGWHIFVLNKITKEHTKAFATVKKDIEKDMYEERVIDELSRFGNQVEDEFAAGKTMEDVAQKFNLNLKKIPSVEQGQKNINGLPDPDILLPLIFSSDVGIPSPLTLLSDNSTYAIIRIDSVSPARIRALDEAKGTAIKMWQEEYKTQKLGEAAKELASKLREGTNLNTLVKKMNLSISKDQKIIRDHITQQEHPLPLLLELFNLKQVDSYTGVYQNKDGDFVLARLSAVEDADHTKNAVGFANLKQQLEEEIRGDIISQYLQYLQKKYPVSIRQSSMAGLQ